MEMLMRTITGGNFHPKSVVMTELFQYHPRIVPEFPGKRLPTEQQEKGGERKIKWRLSQEAEANPPPPPLPEMKFGPGSNLRLAMDMEKEMTG